MLIFKNSVIAVIMSGVGCLVFLSDPRVSDPGDGVQAQLWRASSRTHGFREVGHTHVDSWRCGLAGTFLHPAFAMCSRECVTPQRWCTQDFCYSPAHLGFRCLAGFWPCATA